MKMVNLILIFIVLVVLVGHVLARVPKQAAEVAPLWNYSVQHNDTLWTIAKRFYPRKDPREMVWEIREINGLRTATIHPGQRLRMPGSANRVEVEE